MTSYYVYLTKQCEDDAKTHNVLNDVKNIAERLERAQSTRGLGPPFGSSPYWKKFMGRPGRLIIQEYRSDSDNIVLCLARYFIRSNSEYEVLYKAPRKYYEKNKIPPEEIESFLKERKKQPPIAPKKPLSAIEQDYLQPAIHHYTDDGAFMESYDWFERISQECYKKYLSRYWDLIAQIESEKFPESQTLVSHPRNTSIKLLYRRFQEHKRTFLIAPINPDNPDDENELRKRYQNILESTQIDLKTIVPRSRRAYPSIITYDEGIWMKVQDSIDANLALSPEEEDILESVLSGNNNGPKYPLFINGRPGSGKSTILQYLFSECLERHISSLNEINASTNPPLYLTYSTALLDQARSSVENILECSAKSLSEGREQKDKTKLDNILAQSFYDFQTFLLEQLPPEVSATFVPACYIDFNQFRKQWNPKRNTHPEHKVRKIGAELAWHAIRTFIKGMQHEPGAEVDPECYEHELARDSKSISDKSFKLIYEYVWKQWYQPLCQENSYWDDQDLAQAVLKHSADKLFRYPSVFCDEAQDFTNIELELIERLSLYSDRQLPSYLAKEVPFAFAGDPFQTLNPTGFNWNAMQSSFHDNIVKQLDATGSANLKFNFQELSFNYRSSVNIVKLLNLIQLLRAVLLRIKGVSPQRSWTGKAILSPVWFRRDNARCQKEIREQAELVIIIPCQENGELEYIQNDSFLASIALKDGHISRNILSPARAKGLEYDRVLLYGFGDEAIQRLPELLEHIRNPYLPPPEIERRLEWEYFLNQFYVAVSRARKRLFIVDSNEALEKFWVFTERSNMDQLLELYTEKWDLKSLGRILPGDSSNWSDDRDDPLELARRWKQQGLAQRDPYQLNLAQSNFERAHYPEAAKLCEAAAYEFSEEFIRAGDRFQELGQPKDACRCYWAGKKADKVIHLVEEFPEIAEDPRFLSANAITRPRNTARQIDDVLTALKDVKPLPFPDGPGEIAAWKWFFERFISKIIQAIEFSDRQHSDWASLVERLATILSHLGISHKAYPELAQLYYLVGDSNHALTHWSECIPKPKQEPDWLVQAKAEAEPFPHNIKSLYILKHYDAVLSAWRNAGSDISKEIPVKQILESAIKENDVAAIRDLLAACNDMDLILTAIKRAQVNPELNDAIPIAIIHCLEANSEWGQIVHFATTQRTTHGALNAQLNTLKIEWPKEVTIAAAVRVLARSERLAHEQAKSQQTISEFLKKYLIIDSNTNKAHQKIMNQVHGLVNMVEVGAAFERAFRLTFALEYYEQCFKKHLLSLSPEEINIAKRRWIKCKQRLSNMQEGTRGNKHRNEAQQKEEEWKLSIALEPEYPELKRLTPLSLSQAIQPPKPSIPLVQELNVNNTKLIVETFKKKQRIILTQADTENQVVCGPQKISSEDLSVKHDSSTDTWMIEEWNIYFKIQNGILFLSTPDGNPIVDLEL